MAVAPWITVDMLTDPTHEDAELAIESASFILWELSGRKYNGVRRITETYDQLGPHELSELPTPILDQGQIINHVAGRCAACGCPHLVKLRGVPVIDVEAVSIKGTSIPLSSVKIHDYSILALSSTAVRCWGSCDTLTITYVYGAQPPAPGKMAAQELANQLIWAATDDDRCTLPARVTSVSRQGVSWAMLDPQDFLEEGRTGLYKVDLFLKTVNPDRARRRPRVFSPDLPRGRTRR